MHSDSRALKIEYFQHVYKLYSHLQFTKYGDRPFAVAGLEKRLLAAFDTQGGFGIFDDGDSAEGGLFHWSLLWQRADENMNLKLIDFSECGIRAPSWSWMAHRGGIEYTDPPYQSAIWEKNGIHPPWSCGGMASLDSYHRDGEVPLTDTVRDFTVRGRKENEVKLRYDTNKTGGYGRERSMYNFHDIEQYKVWQRNGILYTPCCSSRDETSTWGKCVYTCWGWYYAWEVYFFG